MKKYIISGLLILSALIPVTSFAQIGNPNPVTNHSPRLGSVVAPTRSINVNQAYNFNFTAKDTDNDNLSWLVTWGDRGDGSESNFNCPSMEANNAFNVGHTWTTPGNYVVKYKVSDCKGGVSENSFTVNIKNITSFYDVSSADPAFGAITEVTKRGIMIGYGNGYFGPNDNLTRAQAALTIVKRFNLPLSKLPATATFTDVPITDTNWQFVEAINRAGFITGCSTAPKQFCPNSPVTRGQYAVFLVRGLGLDPATASTPPFFTDIDSSHYAFPFVQLLSDKGVKAECAVKPLRFCPNDNLTRVQAALLLNASLDVDAGTYGLVPNGAQVLGAATFHFTQTLKVGSVGTEVMELQKFLISHGYDAGAPNGIFEQGVKVAVMQFQMANNLYTDGVVGARTRAVLNQ